jgi:hypothetical protein
MYFGPDQGSLDFDTVIGQIEALATEQHHYKTVVIDSITKLFNTAITDEQTRLGDKDAFGASKKGPDPPDGPPVRWLNRADMNAVVIAHQKDMWGKDAKGNREVVGRPSMLTKSWNMTSISCCAFPRSVPARTPSASPISASLA